MRNGLVIESREKPKKSVELIYYVNLGNVCFH